MIPIQHTINTPYMVGPVHCYSGERGGDLVLFDTGPPTAECRRFLRENIDLDRLKHVLITHCHIDHYGQVAWLCENSGATIYLPARDCEKIREHDKRMGEMYHLLSSLGFSEESLDELRKIFESGALFPPFPREYYPAETSLPEHLGIEIVSCPGHSQSDLVYVGEQWAVTGDTLLRGVFQSPLLDVDLSTGRRFKNYEIYTQTLKKLAGLRGKTILPGHRKRLVSIDETLVFYNSKMLSRVRHFLPFRDEENILVILDKMLGSRVNDVFHMYLKASEVVFMKDFLQRPDLLRTSLEEIGIFARLAPLFFEATNQEY
ncbi:MBL fold metallo-hydrolase [Desulfomarina sp.]